MGVPASEDDYASVRLLKCNEWHCGGGGGCIVQAFCWSCMQVENKSKYRATNLEHD